MCGSKDTALILRVGSHCYLGINDHLVVSSLCSMRNRRRAINGTSLFHYESIFMLRTPKSFTMSEITSATSKKNTQTLHKVFTQLRHPAGRTLNSDWSANSVLMVANENFFVKIHSEFSVQGTNKIFSHRQPLQTIYEPVKSECFSSSVFVFAGFELH